MPIKAIIINKTLQHSPVGPLTYKDQAHIQVL